MLYIYPDQMLIMATQIKDDHKVTFEDLQDLVAVIKKNIEGTKIRVMIPVYPITSNGNLGWQKHFHIQDGKYHPFNTGEDTEKYNKNNMELFKQNLIESGLTELETQKIIFNSLSEYRELVNTDKKSKKRTKKH